MNGNGFITILEALDAVDNFHADHRRGNAEFEVIRDTMEGARAKILFNGYILLATEEEAKQMTYSLHIAKSVQLQTDTRRTPGEHQEDIRRTRAIAHGVPADITENWLGDYFSKFRLVEYVF